MTVEIQEDEVRRMVGAIVVSYDCVGLIGAREAIRCVKLVIRPPGVSPCPQQIKRQHRQHSYPKNEYPVDASSGRWLIMNDKPLIAALDNLISCGIDIASGASRHSGPFVWVIQLISQV